MAEHEITDVEQTHVAKPIKWIIPDSIRTNHATHLILQAQGTEFVLLFFETQAPILVGTPEEQAAAAQKIEHIEAICTAKIVMSIENATLAATNFSQVVNNALIQMSQGQSNYMQVVNDALKQITKGLENAND